MWYIMTQLYYNRRKTRYLRPHYRLQQLYLVTAALSKSRSKLANQIGKISNLVRRLLQSNQLQIGLGDGHDQLKLKW